VYRRILALLVASAVIIGVTAVVSSGDAGGVDATTAEFSAGITPGSTPSAIAAGPDGNMWFTEPRQNDRDLSAPGQVAKITPAGVVTEYGTGIGAHRRPVDIVAGPDGNMWFTELSLDEAFNIYRGIGRITPSGAITEFALTRYRPRSIAAGSDGNLWFTISSEFNQPASISRITPAAVVIDFSDGLRPNAEPTKIVAGRDGNVWFLDYPDTIGRIDAGGKIREFPLGPDVREVAAIAAGADGNVWVTANDAGGASQIVRVKPDGTPTGFTAGITPGRFAAAITVGPDGSLWFVEANLQGTVGVGRITTDGAITEFLSPVAANSGETGIATGCDGNLWLTEPETDRVVRFTPPASNATPKLPVACTASAKNTPSTTTTKPKKKSKRK
jgi:streptogramin lyase